jgi:hypothetical protein
LTVTDAEQDSIFLFLLEGDAKNAHLPALDGAAERLRLFKADLLDYGSMAAAVAGCDVVFHVACPVLANSTPNPEARQLSVHPSFLSLSLYLFDHLPTSENKGKLVIFLNKGKLVMFLQLANPCLCCAG